MARQITDYLLYRQRYLLGYGVFALIIIGLLIVAGLYIPGGLSQSETSSVIASSKLSLSLNTFDPSVIVNLPYHILQRISIDLFGVSPISIKLPSLILGALSTLGLLILLRTWFKENVAVLTLILVITTGQFLFVAQSGTSGIVYIFGSVWLLVSAMMISRQAKLMGIWKMALFGLAALSLYTPLSFYMLIALLSAVILHPHLRYIVRRLSKVKLFFAAVCGLIIIAPLVYVCVRHPSTGLMLLGIPETLPNLGVNALQLIKQYFDFIAPVSATYMTPIYGLGSMILIVLGIIRLFTTKYTARSYIISAWVILLIPVLLVNPSYISVTFLPGVLLMGMGISLLFNRWYRLFPRNPYARIAGLIPLIVLIGGMVFSGIDRYMYGYLYDPRTASNFSNDLKLVNTQLNNKNRGNAALVVTPNEMAFYTVVAAHHKNTVINIGSLQTSGMNTVIFSQAAYHEAPPAGVPYRIITNSQAASADRFYIYKIDVK